MDFGHLLIIVIISVCVFALIEYFRTSLGFIYWRKLKLKIYEVGYLNNYSKKIKRTLIFCFCIEVFIGFYLDVFRELADKQQKDKILNRRLMDFCIAVIQKKYYLSSVSDDSIYKETLPEEIYAKVKDKEQSVRMLTASEERELFNRDLKRIKRIFNHLVIVFDKNHSEKMYDQICTLAVNYKKIGVVPLRNLFYHAYHFMADYDRVISLKLYLHYLNVKRGSITFKHKAIIKYNVTKLFDNETQKQKFETICDQFRQDNDLEKAFERTEELFKRGRRKISLHIDSIREANTMQHEVAQMLGQYLDSDEPVKNEQPVVVESDHTLERRKELFDLFISHSFRLNQQELNIFAASRGLFRDTFIERINDDYYETFDDLLIEEDGDDYVLNEDYYKQLNG